MNKNWTEKQAGNGRMILHCGAELVQEDDLRRIKTPAPNGNHYPTNFAFFFETIAETLTNRGFQIGECLHALSHENARYFGLMSLSSIPPYEAEAEVFNDASIVQHVVGIRASHDKTFSNQLVMGTRVFVCDNLAFSGQIMLRRKNTRFAHDHLPMLADKAVDVVRQGQISEEMRMAKYRNTFLDEEKTAHALVQCAEAGAFGGSAILPILNEYRNPSHEQHSEEGHTIWTLQQALTERFKSYALSSIPDRSLRCQRTLDRLAGFEPVLSGIIDID